MAKQKKAVKKSKPSKKAASTAKKQDKKSLAKKTSKKKANKNRKENGSVDLECFLTTACLTHRGLPDDCFELKTLRTFRDTFLQKTENDRKMVNEYSVIGPALVQAIESGPSKKETYSYIYSQITKACENILNKRPSTAREVYVDLVKRLKRKYKLSSEI